VKNNTRNRIQVGKIHSLRDLFEAWCLPASFTKDLSPDWRCRIAPSSAVQSRPSDNHLPRINASSCDSRHVASQIESNSSSLDVHASSGTDPSEGGYSDIDSAEERVAARLAMQGVPFHPAASLAHDLFAEVGQDVFAYLLRPEWNEFPRPRFAMLGGWGAPGTRVEGEEHVTLVRSFQELLDGEQSVNLQMFHRDSPDAPKLPVLPRLLKWPLKRLLDGEDGEMAVVCDMATRVSRRGAVTWWHIDDGGEFVLQV
jgi:hypothetical protein